MRNLTLAKIALDNKSVTTQTQEPPITKAEQDIIDAVSNQTAKGLAKAIKAIQASKKQINTSNTPSTPNPSPWTINSSNSLNNMEKICIEIKQSRIAVNLTQRDLAARSGMSQGTITRAERHGWISIRCLMKIAKGLNKEIHLI